VLTMLSMFISCCLLPNFISRYPVFDRILLNTKLRKLFPFL